jgi:signal transduction histidine kinase
LVPTLQALVRDFSLDWGRRIVLEVSDDVALPGNAQVLLYQVLREALLNALRHSGARLLRVCVARHQCGIEATVEDNGIGFVPTEGGNDSHFGLALIRERVGRLGGEVEIHSEPEKGTRLSVAIPLGNDREPR